MFWYIPALVSAVFTSFSDITKKRILNHENTREFIVLDKIFQLVLIALLLFPFIEFKIPLFIIGILFLISIIVSFAYFYLMSAFKHKDISLVAPLTNLTPLFLLVFAFVFLKEKLGLIHFGGVALLVLGTYILEVRHHIFDIKLHFNEISKSKYTMYVIFAAFLYAITATADKFVLSYITPYTALAYISLFIAINFLFASKFIFKLKLKNLQKGLKNFGNWILLGSFFEVISNIAYFLAISLNFVSLVIPIRRLSTLFDTIIGGEFFKEKNLLQKSLACIVMLIGVFLIIL